MAPNILYIMADQMAAFVLPFYGQGQAKVPNMERLVENGTTFDAAYCSSPICASSRYSMMAGQLPSRIGAYDNATEFSCSVPTFAHYLRILGYRTCLSGKMHFVGPDQLHGFEERVTTDIYASDFTWAADWSKKDLPYSPSAMSPAGALESGICNRSLQLDYDDEVTFAAQRKLFDYARYDRDKPFFLCASYTHPHNPFTITQQFWDWYDDVEIDMPHVPYIPYEERDPWSQRHFLTIRQDEYEVPDDIVLRTRRAYYAMVSYVDDQIGKLMQALKETNLDDNTTVIFAADHGEMMGERGMWYKFNPFEHSIRVPMFANIPGENQPRREDRAVSLMDLLPTFLDLATDGSPPELAEPIDGQSLAPMLHGEDETRGDEVAVEYFAEGVYAPGIVLCQDQMKYVHCGDDPGMLYDLRQDPHEMLNLAADEKFAATAARMRSEILSRWDYEALSEDVERVQRRRRLVQEAKNIGVVDHWDYTPIRDGSKEYVRPVPGDPSTTNMKRRARYPLVEAAIPDRKRKVVEREMAPR